MYTAIDYLKALEIVIRRTYDFDYEKAIEHGDLSVNQTRSGRAVLWFFNEIRECCVYLDTAEELTEEEIEEELL